MALKDKAVKATETPATIPATSTPAAENGEHKRRGRQPGTVNKPGFDWTRERQSALINLLKAPSGPGSTKTPQSVHVALLANSLFMDATPELTTNDVKSWVEAAQKQFEKAKMEIPEWCNLASGRVSRKVDTELLFA
jgi:hypothetical protein